jgi:recombination protein RecA
MYNEGISRSGDVLDIAVDRNIVEKRGAFYTYGETRLAQGRENAKQHLREHPDVLADIESRVRQSFEISRPPAAGRPAAANAAGSDDLAEDSLEVDS